MTLKRTFVIVPPLVMALSGCTLFQDAEKSPCKPAKTVPILTARQRTHLDLPRDVRTNNYNQADYRKQLRGPDRDPGWYPEPLKLTWEGDPEATYEVTVRRTKDGSVYCRMSVKGTSCALDNFEVACSYEWTAVGGGVSHAGAFVTEDRTPRLLRVPGVPNVRDLGGYRTSYGRRVRQNRVFRSAGLNDNAYVPHGKELDKLLAEAETGPLKGALTRTRQQIDAFRRLAETKEKVPYVTVDWGDGSWNVHDIVALTSSALTDAFAAGRTTEASSRATVGKDGYLRFDGTGLVALDRTFTSPADGYMLLDATGDWYWALMLNGCLFANYYTNGNGCNFTDYHHLLLPVKKGENKLEVILRNGTASWCFSCRPGVPGTKDYANRAAKRLEESLSNLFKCAGRTRIGPQNREFLLQTLGIRSDIDLRSEGECYGMTGSPLGPTVNWFHISSECYAGFGYKSGRGAFAKVFRVFLDEANYPIDFHCIAGQDRTGAVAYTLLALLGVDDEDIWKDWEASGFWNSASGWLNYNNFNKLLKVFDGYEGANTREKAERHVLSLGFTMADIAHFRELMLEN